MTPFSFIHTYKQTNIDGIKKFEIIMALPLKMELRSYGHAMEEQEGHEEMQRKQVLNSTHQLK